MTQNSNRVKLDSPEAFAAAFARMTEYEQKNNGSKCVKCDFPLEESDFSDFSPDKGYEYCHSFCCPCCPDYNKDFLKKSKTEMMG